MLFIFSKNVLFFLICGYHYVILFGQVEDYLIKEVFPVVYQFSYHFMFIITAT